MKKIFLLIALLVLLAAGAQAQEANKTCAYFFYSDGCPYCAQADAQLKLIEAEHPELEIHRININSDWELIMGLYEKYEVPESVNGRGIWGHVPIMFVGKGWYLGPTQIVTNIEKQLELYSETGVKCPDEISFNPDQNADQNIGGNGTVNAQEISLPQLLGLAAVDAINPCELAVLVILMTAILTRYPNKKRKALQAGLSFSAAIFLMYLVFGLLIILGFKFLVGFTNVGGDLFFNLLAIVAIILGILNIKDAIWYGGGGFIMEVPQSWRPKMKRLLATVGMGEAKSDCPGCEIMQKEGTMQMLENRSVVIGAFLVGLIVSFFLTPCTAGPYFVAGGILSKIPVIVALPYLLLYLIVFIAPMVILTLIAYTGFLAIEDIGGWREKNIKKLHWVAGLLLLGLGIAMLLKLI